MGAAPDERLGLWVQECLLGLLTFDDSTALMLAGGVPVSCFEGDYHTIATRYYEYVARYRAAPGEHAADLLSDLLDGEDAQRAARFDRIIKALYERWEEGINKALILGRLNDWTRQQQLKGAVIQAAQLLQSGDPGALDKVESLILAASRARTEHFDAGVHLADLDNVAEWLYPRDTADSFPTGVGPLDELGLGPIRGGLHLLIAPAKHGKTHWLVNLGKRAAVAGLKVAHVSLEMSERRIAQRYMQSVFGLPKHDAELAVPRLQVDKVTGLLDSIDIETIRPRLTLESENVVGAVTRRGEALKRVLSRIVIKSYPPRSLTVDGLDAYLEGLAAAKGFVPDLLIVDYADLLNFDTDSYRINLGVTYERLRGLGGLRNMAVATASQSNREGAKAKVVDTTNVAEDWSKIATADCVLTYSRSDAERELGLARLLVAAGRDDTDRFTVIVTQLYDTAQFVLDAIRMPADYWTLIGQDPM